MIHSLIRPDELINYHFFKFKIKSSFFMSRNFHSESISIYGECTEFIEHPASVAVSIDDQVWAKMVETMDKVPFFNATLDIRDLEGTDFIARDTDRKTIELYELEEPLEFSCYRLHKPFTEKPSLYLSLQAKYHNTFIIYELSDN